MTTQTRKLDGSFDRVFARQVLPPRTTAQTSATPRATTKLIYLNRDGVLLWPGGQENDAASQTSSIVTEPTLLGSWDVDDETWAETVDCVKELYRPFDVTITDEDPGDQPHLEAHFGGSPLDVGLPDNVAGVSPFTEDCGIIEDSIVFTFTDVMPDNPRTMCEVMAQEIAHSYGLDHEMLASDPMTYLDYNGDRSFKDQDAACGEYGNRLCGINGNMCRRTQNSVQLLTERLGPRGGGAPSHEEDPMDEGPESTGEAHVVGGGCSAGGEQGGGFFVVVGLGLGLATRSRSRRFARSRA